MQFVDEEETDNSPQTKNTSNPDPKKCASSRIQTNVKDLQNLIIGFRTVIDQTGTYFFTKDTAGIYTYVNQKVEELFGDTLENIVGKDDSHFFDLELADDLRQNDRLVIEEGKIIEKEEQNIIKATGETRYYWTIKKPLFDDAGQIIGMCGISTDITERKVMENTLRTKESHLRLSQACGGIGTWEIDLTTNKQTWSESCVTLFGFPSQASPTWDDFLKVVHPEDREHVAEAIRAHIENNTKYDVEYRISYNYGDIRWMRSIGELERTVDGKPNILRGIVQEVTNHKLAQLELEQSLSLLAATLDSTQDAVLVVDLNGKWTLHNKRFLDLWNITPELIDSRDDNAALAYVLSQLEDADIFISKVMELYSKPHANSFDTLTFKIGKVVERYSIPQRINGVIVGRVWSFRDITEHIQAKQALKREAEKNLAILRNASDGIHILDYDGNILEVSDSFCSMLGYQRDELIGMNVSEWDAEFIGEELLNVVRRQFENPIRSEFETRHRRKDGTIFNVEVSGYPLVLDGRPVLFNSSRDITERKTNEAELRLYRQNLEDQVQQRTKDLQEAHQKLLDTQFAMESVGIAIDWIDFESGRFIYVNRQLAEMLNYSIEEMHKLRIVDIAPDLTIESYDKIREKIRVEGHRQFETIYKSKDGHEIPVEVAIYFKEGINDTNSFFISFTTDTSRRKAVEEALRQAKESAEAANVAKSAFLANMSHEIRTPMSGVIGLTDVLLNTQLTPEQTKMARLIHDSANTQLTILNDILDFSKIEAGKLELAPESFSLKDIVGKVCSLLDRNAIDKGVILTKRMDSAIPSTLEGDPLRVRQILSNLISNAIKFTSNTDRLGKVDVLTRLVSDEGERVWIEFIVQDNGIGMDSATQERIFQPFIQADSSTSKRYGGTGLGLVITLRLVEMMRGKLRIDSTPGQGSTLNVCLPFLRLDETKQSLVIDEVPLSSIKISNNASTQKILVAEDNETNQEVIHQQLVMLGYQADIANDGREALTLWLKGDYGLIISDIHMPRMDGYQLAQAIRLEERKAGTNRIPIVALTANVLKGEADHCKEVGMDDYLAKPAPLPLMKAMLEKWLPHETESENPPAQTPQAESSALVVFDPDMLTKMVGDNPTIHHRLLEKFLVNAEERIAVLQQAVDNDDAVAASQAAHPLKSAARSVGAMQMGDLSEQIEKASKASDPAFKALLPDLIRSFDTTSQTISAYLKKKF